MTLALVQDLWAVSVQWAVRNVRGVKDMWRRSRI